MRMSEHVTMMNSVDIDITQFTHKCQFNHGCMGLDVDLS